MGIAKTIPKSAFLTKIHTIPAGTVSAAAACFGSLLNKAHSGEVDLINTVSVYHAGEPVSMIPKSTPLSANYLSEQRRLHYTTS